MKRMIFLLAMSLFLPATVNAADIDGNYHVLTPPQGQSDFAENMSAHATRRAEASTVTKISTLPGYSAT